jgi:hypothetical protein
VKSHEAEVTSRRGAARASVFGVALLITMALVSALSSGCGGSASPPASSVPVPTQSVAATPATEAVPERTAPTLSLHQRIMIEQGLATGSAATYHRTPATATNAPQPADIAVVGTSESATAPRAPFVAFDSPTVAILVEGQTPLRGVWSGTAEQLASYLLGVSPSPAFTVSASALAEYYVRYCAEAGLRADLLWAQMMHETGSGTYGGDVGSEQNNYAGIGATGGGQPGISFATAEAGVMAHVAHMVAYVYTASPVSWADATTDPRFDFVNPRGTVSVLADLNGRWAVPGNSYGERIEDLARAINAD